MLKILFFIAMAISGCDSTTDTASNCAALNETQRPRSFLVVLYTDGSAIWEYRSIDCPGVELSVWLGDLPEAERVRLTDTAYVRGIARPGQVAQLEVALEGVMERDRNGGPRLIASRLLSISESRRPLPQDL